MNEEKLKARAFKAIGWDFLGTFATQGIGFIISIILARLLSPEDFGLVGMSMAFIAISQVFSDMGFGSALIQNKENTALMYSSVFWLNIIVGLALLALLYTSAPYIGRFYDSVEIPTIVRWLAIGVFINSFNIVQTSILTRNLQFKELTTRQLIAGSLSGIIGVILAFKGFGVYALVYQSICAAIITTIVLWKVSDWKPNFQYSWKSIKGLTNFSIYVFSARAMNRIITKLDALVIGKLFSPLTLGFFTRANSLEQLVRRYTSGVLGKVLFPTLSKLQDDKERFVEVYHKILPILLFGVFFISGCLLVSGEFIIITLFGEKWRPSVLIFQVLMFKIFNYPINSLIVNSFLSLGLAKQDFWIGNIRKACRLVPFVIAYFYGFSAFLFAIVAVSVVLTLFNLVMASVYLKIKFKAQMQDCLFFMSSFILGVLPSFIIEANVILLHTALSIFCFICIFVFISFLFKRKVLIFLFLSGTSLFRKAKFIFKNQFQKSVI